MNAKIILGLLLLTFCLPSLANRYGDEQSVDVSNDQQLALQQDIDLTENSLVTIAPALSANGVYCDMESDSVSILIFSKGKSRCTEVSEMWRNVAQFGSWASTLGFNTTERNEIVISLLCHVKEMKRAMKSTGFNCHAATKSPIYRARLLETGSGLVVTPDKESH